MKRFCCLLMAFACCFGQAFSQDSRDFQTLRSSVDSRVLQTYALSPSSSTIRDFQDSWKSGKTFLFIGDSVTDGNWGVKSNSKQRSYTDLNHIYGHGYMYICAAETMRRFPQRRYVFHNRGISGNTIVDMAVRWQNDCLDLQPDVLTVLVGINDVCAYRKSQDALLAPVAYEANYRALLDAALQENPHLQMILITPFIAPVGRYEKDYEQWLSLTNSYADIVRRLAKEYKATLIDAQRLFDKQIAKGGKFRPFSGKTQSAAEEEYPVFGKDVPRQGQISASYWIWDGIHPTAAGHALIAEQWQKKVRLGK